VTLKVDSIDTANQKRDEHLEGPDFFSAKQFPTIEFKSTKVTKVDDTHYDVEGTLTLHGVNKPISVKLEKTGSGRTPMTGPIVGYATEFKIKRSDYGMKLMIGPLGDDVLLIVALECAAK
jgi:polyisoprenoid-binding protein YceI